MPRRLFPWRKIRAFLWLLVGRRIRVPTADAALRFLALMDTAAERHESGESMTQDQARAIFHAVNRRDVCTEDAPYLVADHHARATVH